MYIHFSIANTCHKSSGAPLSMELSIMIFQNPLHSQAAPFSIPSPVQHRIFGRMFRDCITAVLVVNGRVSWQFLRHTTMRQQDVGASLNHDRDVMLKAVVYVANTYKKMPRNPPFTDTPQLYSPETFFHSSPNKTGRTHTKQVCRPFPITFRISFHRPKRNLFL